MSKVIAVTNQKGGCGKSNVSVNLAAALVKQGQKVLVVDADPQGSCTISLGYPQPDDMDYTLADIMMEIVNGEEPDADRVMLHQEEGIDLIPANITLSALEVSLVGVMSREMIMKEFIDSVRDRYDTVLIDCIVYFSSITRRLSTLRRMTQRKPGAARGSCIRLTIPAGMPRTVMAYLTNSIWIIPRSHISSRAALRQQERVIHLWSS